MRLELKRRMIVKTFDWLGGMLAAMGLALGGALLAAVAIITFLCGLALEIVAVVASAAYPIAGKIADGLARASEAVVHNSRNLLAEVRDPRHVLGSSQEDEEMRKVHTINGGDQNSNRAP